MASFLGRELGVLVQSKIAYLGGAQPSLSTTQAPAGGQISGQVATNKQVAFLKADGCGLSEREISVADDHTFSITLPQDQPAGECQLILAVGTPRAGEDFIQIAVSGFTVTVSR